MGTAPIAVNLLQADDVGVANRFYRSREVIAVVCS